MALARPGRGGEAALGPRPRMKSLAGARRSKAARAWIGDRWTEDGTEICAQQVRPFLRGGLQLAEAKPCNQPSLGSQSDAMPRGTLHPRFAEALLVEALADTPVVLIHGPRQSGKTTLAQRVRKARSYAYFSFDDDVALAAARSDPVGFVGDLPDRSILDDVQRAPEQFTALKMAVDRDRTPGRFLLTGSANVLLVPRLAESLAGRMEIVRLHPLAQCELAGEMPRFLDALFEGRFKLRSSERLGKELAERIAAGGFPAALARKQPRRRAAWYEGYIETLVQRDVRDLARIQSLDALPRLLTLAAGQTARLINISEPHPSSSAARRFAIT